MDGPAGPSKQTHATRVAAELRREILMGTIRPGERLNLNRLRERLGISLSPLREAISRLAAERLILVEDQRGFRAPPVSHPDLAEITAMRADLECLALGLSIDSGTLDWEGGVLSALHRLERAAATERETAALAFHAALCAGSGRPMLGDLCRMTANLHARYRNILGGASDADAAAIADAAVARRRDAALALLRARIEAEGADLARHLGAVAVEKHARGKRT